MDADLTCPVHGEGALVAGIDGAKDQFFGIGDRYSYRRCATCGALVLDPRPSPQEIGPYYAGYYTDATLAHLRKRAAEGRRVGIAGRLRALGTIKRLGKLGARVGPGQTLLDVGCGLGGFAGSMKKFAGVDARGVDFSTECRDFAKEVHGLEVDVGELADQAYPDDSFDFVTSWHYLEHVYDPAADLQQMARVLKPGGWLVAETPTPDVLAKLFGKRWLYLMPPTHLYHYRPETMRALVERTGLEVVHVARPWFPGELAGSLTFAMGIDGFVPKVFSPNRSGGEKLLTAAFFAQMIYDVPITAALALLGRSGLMRIYARKRGTA